MKTQNLQREIVISRLMAIPPNLKLSIGEYGAFNNDQLVQHVQKNDDVGKAVLDMQMSYLQSLKTRFL